jgi:osmotically-inducible protein OsmY
MPNSIDRFQPSFWARLTALALLSVSFLGCASLQCMSAGCRADARIAAQVQALFSQHTALETPNEIEIQVVHRVVYLRGIVSTPYEHALAEEVARQADGVARVVNLIGLDNNR